MPTTGGVEGTPASSKRLPDLELPEDIRKRIAQLDNAPDEASRLALEARFVLAEPDKPLDHAHDLSASELDAITAPILTGSAVHADNKMSASIKIIKTAQGELGYRETGTNCTKYGEWYGKGFHCAQWCDTFVSWVFHHAGLAKYIGGKFSYVPYHYAWFHKHKRFHRRGAKGGGPSLGGIILFDWEPNGTPNHIGIVVGHTDTHVHTIEGNSQNKVSAHSYERSYRGIMGYGYPTWS